MRHWPATDGKRIITGMISRRQRQAASAERLGFETFLAGLSGAFVRTPAKALHKPIQDGLQQLVEFFALDSSTLVEIAADQSTLHRMYSYVKPGARADVSTALDEPAWFTATLRRGEIVRCSRPDDLPVGRRVELPSRLAAGRHSSVTIPLMIDGAVQYAMAFSVFHPEYPWPDALIARLRLVGDLFAAAISRQHRAATACALEQELIHLTRVAMLGELAATLAHEISRPLAAILTNVQAAHRFLTLPCPQLEAVQEALDDVIVDTRRAAELLQRLRSLAKKTALKWTAFDTNEMIQEVVNLVGGEAGMRQVSITLRLQDDLPDMYGDRIQLQQVVLNLVLNAFEAIAEVVDGPREIVVCTRCEPSEVITVSVEDSGMGLADDLLRRIFEPFFSTKADGMGMGLAISRSIIMTHHGRIWASAAPGRGLTVSFSIPADRKEMV